MKRGIIVERVIYTTLIIFLIVLLVRNMPEERVHTYIGLDGINITNSTTVPEESTNETYQPVTVGKISLSIDDFKFVTVGTYKKITEVEVNLKNIDDAKVNVYIYDDDTREYDKEYVRHREHIGEGKSVLKLDRPASFLELGSKKYVVVRLYGEDGFILETSRQFSIG